MGLFIKKVPPWIHPISHLLTETVYHCRMGKPAVIFLCVWAKVASVRHLFLLYPL